MVSKSSAPHSIRFRNELWERVCARAKRDKITPNEAVIALVDAGLALAPVKLKSGPFVPPPVTTDYLVKDNALIGKHTPNGGDTGHVSIPLHKPKPFNPQPKRGKK